jgi:hypothetical protein
MDSNHTVDPNAPSKAENALNTVPNSTTRAPPAPLKMTSSPSPHSGHRSSFAENMRGVPPSPRRASRQPSFSQSALHDLLNNPPTKAGDPKFQGRDWRSVKVGEIVEKGQVRFVEYDTSVEEATNVSAVLVVYLHAFQLMVG